VAEPFQSELQGAQPREPQCEIESAALYRALAKAETSPDIAKIYDKLASVEEAPAEFWESYLMTSGERIPVVQLGWRNRALRWECLDWISSESSTIPARFAHSWYILTIEILKGRTRPVKYAGPHGSFLYVQRCAV
jgi:hypothetical protein